MGLFQKKEDYDIHCYDRRLKDIIDDSFKEKPENIDYECVARYYVSQGIKYHKLLKNILDNGYSKHKCDSSCNIPDYKTFLSLEQKMIDNQEDFIGKSVCVEGYVAYYLWSDKPWSRCNAGVFIYPLPCKTDVELQINYDLIDELHATDSIILISDIPLPLDQGTHIRVHGTPSFYDPRNGERAGKVHLLVHDYEIIET